MEKLKSIEDEVSNFKRNKNSSKRSNGEGQHRKRGNSRAGETNKGEGSTSRHNNKPTEITQSAQETLKKNQTRMYKRHGIMLSCKSTQDHYFRRGRKINTAKEILEEVMTENFPKLITDTTEQDY